MTNATNNAPNNTPIYASREAFEADFSTLAKLERQRATKADRLAAKITNLQEKHTADIEGLNADIDAIRERLTDYAESHRDELTDHGKTKSLSFGGCNLKWRKKPASVKITGEVKDIIAALRKRRLSRCIRVKEEINKTAIKAEAERLAKKPIEGIAIVGGDEVISIDAGIK